MSDGEHWGEFWEGVGCPKGDGEHATLALKNSCSPYKLLLAATGRCIVDVTTG